MAGDNKQISTCRPVYPNWPKIDEGRPMVSPHLPWNFHANRPSRFLVILLTKKQTKKQRNRAKTKPRSPIGGGVIKCDIVILLIFCCEQWPEMCGLRRPGGVRLWTGIRRIFRGRIFRMKQISLCKDCKYNVMSSLQAKSCPVLRIWEKTLSLAINTLIMLVQSGYAIRVRCLTC